MGLPCLRDRSQPLPSAGRVLARIQSQVADHLLAAGEALHRTQRQHEGQRGHRPHSGMRPQQNRCLILLGLFFHRPIQLRQRAVELVQHLQQLLPAMAGPAPRRRLSNSARPFFVNSCFFRHTPSPMASACSWLPTALRIHTSFCRCHTSCRRSRSATSAARSAGSVLPPAAAAGGRHRARRSSACAPSMPGSAPHRPSTTRVPTRPACARTSACARWPRYPLALAPADSA